MMNEILEKLNLREIGPKTGQVARPKGQIHPKWANSYVIRFKVYGLMDYIEVKLCRDVSFYPLSFGNGKYAFFWDLKKFQRWRIFSRTFNLNA